jgi:(1->4)-alpha-D-glucan 1-alpha-D-glucosylmutase
LVVEKILGRDEPLPEDWPVAGTTGYDFLNAANGLFVDPKGLDNLDRHYHHSTGCDHSYGEVCYQRNKQVIRELFAGELAAFTRSLGNLALRDRYARDLPLSELVRAFVEVTACLPVYRTYIRSFSISNRDRAYLDSALAAVRRRTSPDEVSDATLDFLRRILLLDPPGYSASQRRAYLRFVLQWQQFTGPVMAKGVEDTASYVYNSLISLNEVGGDTLREKPPHDVRSFHEFNRNRLLSWPHTMNTTSTHDTKRSEDVRARINALSELDSTWLPRLHRWSRWNRPCRTDLNGRPVPGPSEESLLYQTMLGAWPLEAAEEASFVERLVAFMLKALREAKTHTSWINPDLQYESAVESFIRKSVIPGGKSRFMEDFMELQKAVAFYGYHNALSQTLLKMTCPGVPDFYQGTELWDFSLVDPDNRRPVDFEKRARLLDELKNREATEPDELLKDLVVNWRDGRIKLFMVRKTLNFRRSHQELFARGEYIPLEGTGRRREHVVAFARHWKTQWVIVAVPRLVTRLLRKQKSLMPKERWPSLQVLLPSECPEKWRNVFTSGMVVSKRLAGGQRILPINIALDKFPVVLLERAEQ